MANPEKQKAFAEQNSTTPEAIVVLEAIEAGNCTTSQVVRFDTAMKVMARAEQTQDPKALEAANALLLNATSARSFRKRQRDNVAQDLTG